MRTEIFHIFETLSSRHYGVNHVDFSWTDEQLEFKRAATEFARKELGHDLLERDQKSEFSREEWQKMARFGVQGLPLPEKYGGTNSDIMTTMLVKEGLGYGSRDNRLLFAVNAQMWGVRYPILQVGTEEQKEKYLPGRTDRCARDHGTGLWIGRVSPA